MATKLLFRSIVIGNDFIFCGSIYHKISSRTARLNGYGSRVFYFSITEVVTPVYK